ncbi:FCH domain-containing protein [Cryptosporidium ubiquitum]|uniref:FCH domain-containing protein n=1 Tax=Cryptosporidium ubiquitum TaxID=857276 RepID=A0A1J4MMG5_9CRYT|nr:FCH domain-containing protein [Cryptosporidium ubiquitum]OII75374.1 FCH domain-containing protein [Cryptosporidium ubiquitum]
MELEKETTECGVKRIALKYKDEFLHDWTLICTRIENGLKLGDQLRQALEERASLEEMYSNGLERISSRFFPSATESTSMTFAIRTLRNETYRRSQQCRELCETLRSDVLKDTLNNMLENHKSAYCHLLSSGKRITSEIQKRYLNFTRLRDNYGIARHNIGQLSLRYHELNRSKSSQEKITLLSKEILRKILELDDLEKEYNNSIESFDTYYKFYLTEMKNIIGILEDMDTKRIKCISDTFMKLMVYDMSYIRNLQYDSDHVIKSIQEIDVEEDIYEFANRFGISNNKSQDSENNMVNSTIFTGTYKFSADQVKKESWREICRKMSNLKINDDEFITFSTSQMAEKNIALDNIVDLQAIISNLVNPATAIKAQKAVKILLSQFNMIVNENTKNYIHENYFNDLEFQENIENVLVKDEKSHSMESFSTACSNEGVTSKNKDKNSENMIIPDESCTENNIERVDFGNIYKEFLKIIMDLNERNNPESKQVIEKALELIHDKEIGLKEYVNCDLYLSVIIDEILKEDIHKLHLYLGDELTQVLFKHMDMIMELIQNEKNTWLFRKMLFISESLIIDDIELFANIYKHDVWSVVKIWEETILICISEQFQRRILESDNIELEKFRMVKDIKCFDILNNVETLSYLMKRFGIPEIPIITLFTKVCSQNGLEKNYCDQLICKIKNTK